MPILFSTYEQIWLAHKWSVHVCKYVYTPAIALTNFSKTTESNSMELHRKLPLLQKYNTVLSLTYNNNKMADFLSYIQTCVWYFLFV